MWSPETLKVLNEQFEAKQAAEEAEGEQEFEESKNEFQKD